MPQSDGNPKPPRSDRGELESLYDEYESALLGGGRPLIADYLPRCRAGLRATLLRELTLLRMAHRGHKSAADVRREIIAEEPDLRAELEAAYSLDSRQVAAPPPSTDAASTNFTAEVSPPAQDNSGSAATIDVQYVTLRCPACAASNVVTHNSDASRIACTKCGIPLGSHAVAAEVVTPNRGDQPTVDQAIGVRGAGDETFYRHLIAGERFRKLNLHAVGGLGEIYLARDEQLVREVALKELQHQHADTPGKRDRFVFEGRVTGKLEHPGIVPIYSLGADVHGRPFYTMRFVRGRSLAKVIQILHLEDDFAIHPSHTGLRSALQNFMAACHALEYAHSRGVLHCDVKPDNIMVGKFGETYVVDWGMARVAGSDLVAYQHDGESPIQPSRADIDPQPGAAMGTPAFMSPEQAVGDVDQLAEATDIFSLGATLFHLLTGKPPYTGKSLSEVISKAAAAAYAPPRELSSRVPRPLEAVCLKAMAKLPSDRYASARQLADDVDRWLGDEPLTAYRDSYFDRARRFARRNRALVGLAASALVLIAVVSTVAALLVNRARLEQIRLTQRNQQLAESEAAAHDEAERRFIQARNTVDVWLTGFSEALQQYPGMTGLRETMLARAADEYERFANEELSRPELREERARTQIRLGNLRRDLGDVDAAVAAYQSAADTLAPGESEGDPSASIVVERARALERLGLALADQHQHADALAALRESIESLEQLANERTSPPPQAVIALATSHISLGTLLAAVEEFDESKRQYDEAAALASRSVSDPDAADALDRLAATAKTGLGQIALAQGDAARAERCFADATNAFENLWLRSDGDPAAREQLATARLARAATLAAQGDLQGQANETQRALEDLSWLAAAYPDIVRYRERVNEALTNLGMAQIELGEFADAEKTLETARDELRTMVADYPLSMGYVRDYAVALDDLAHLRMLAGAYGLGLADANEAARILSELAAAAPDLAGLRERLAVVESHRAQALWDLGERDAAVEQFATASSLVQEIVRRAEVPATLLPNLAVIEERYGEALHTSGDDKAAHRHWQAAAELWDRWDSASHDGRAAQQAAEFFLTCPDETIADPARALALASAAYRMAPQNSYAAALVALAQSKLGRMQPARTALARFGAIEHSGKAATRPAAWMAMAAASINAQEGHAQLARKQLGTLREWEANVAPGDWAFRAMRKAAEAAWPQDFAPFGENSPQRLKASDDGADGTDSSD